MTKPKVGLKHKVRFCATATPCCGAALTSQPPTMEWFSPLIFWRDQTSKVVKPTLKDPSWPSQTLSAQSSPLCLFCLIFAWFLSDFGWFLPDFNFCLILIFAWFLPDFCLIYINHRRLLIYLIENGVSSRLSYWLASTYTFRSRPCLRVHL